LKGEGLPVENTKALSKRRGTKLARPSGQDVACPSSTTAGSESFGFSKDKIIVSLLAMLKGLSRECLSQDMWFLAMSGARRIAIENGVPEKDFMAIQAKVFELQQAGKKSNPMNCMF
jgi:hypothetical protein